LGFAAQQGQHGLVAAVDAVKVANREGAGRGQSWVLKAAKNLHGVLYFLRAVYARSPSGESLCVT
jgi:hypothetical protein